MYQFQFKVDGVLTDAESVKFNDPTGSYGLRRTDINEILVAAGEDWTRVGLGTYQYDDSALSLASEVIYDYWIEAFYDLEYIRLQRFITGDVGVAVTQKILRFVCIKNNEYVSLDTPPLLSSPTGTYGVLCVDTNEVITSNETAMFANGTLYAAAIGEPAANLKYRYYVKAIVDGIEYLVPRTTQYMQSANLLIGRYTDSTKVEMQFGSENIHKWVALDDGDEAVDYAMREYQCIVDAEQQVDDIVQGYYIRDTFIDPVPREISQAATMIAGCLMYEARGIVDSNPITGETQHKYIAHRRAAEKTLRNIKMGRLRLEESAAPSLPTAKSCLPHRKI